MYSIICCSINPQEAERLRENIAQTIGVPFEFILFDNRTNGYGLCKVYNLCAAKAQHEYLCFVHEDVRFQTQNWGKILHEQLSQPDCGVIGFAGSIIKLKQLTGWNTCGKDLRANYGQYMRGRIHPRQVNPNKESYSPVVTLDGLCLLVRRDVWKEIPFDETTFTGFHSYDLDYSLAVAQQYKNYVTHTVFAEHYSEGSFSPAWLNELKRLHEKWENYVPMAVPPFLKPMQLPVYQRFGEAHFIKFMWQKGRFDVKGFKDAIKYWKQYPLHAASWMLFLKYVKYRIRHLKKR